MRVPILVLMLVGLAASSSSAEVGVTGSIDRPAIGVGESAVLTIVIEGSGSRSQPQFEIPDGLRIREAGTSQSYSLVNGRLSQSVEIRYLILATREGVYSIGPIRIDVSGRAYTVGPYRLEAVAGAPPRAPDRPSPDPRGATEEAPLIFVELEIDPADVFVGEQVIARSLFWSRTDVVVVDARFLPPETEGFWREALPPERRGRRSRYGAAYDVSEIVTALFPTREGTLTVGAARVAVRFQEPGRRRGDPFFPFGFGAREREAEPASRSRAVRVRPLPRPAPPAFKGAVGRFEATSRLDREEAAQGEPITWTIEISGKGNIAALEGPAFPEIPGCRGFDAGSEVEITSVGDRVGGTKRFSRALIPESAGWLELPAIGWSSFDPSSGSYRTIEIPGRRVRVAAAQADAFGPTGRVGGGLRGIRSEARLAPLSSAAPWRGFAYWAWLLAPAIALVAAHTAKRRREETARDPAGARLRAAPRRLRAALRAVEGESGDPWGRLAKALDGYLGDQYGAEARGLPRAALAEHIVARGADSDAASAMANLLLRIDRMRYAPAEEAGAGGLREAVERAGELAGLLRRRGRG